MISAVSITADTGRTIISMDTAQCTIAGIGARIMGIADSGTAATAIIAAGGDGD